MVTTTSKKNPEVDIRAQALGLMQRYRQDYMDANVFVTDRVYFQMKELIRILRKNYFGIFDTATDPTTGRLKTWVPLTESTVETIVKSIDLDTKDINFRAKKPSAIGLANIVREGIKNELDRMFFGEYLDQLERDICTDGTAIWKTLEIKGEDGLPQISIHDVDLLNFYIDPTAKCIQEANVLERAVMTPDEFQAMDGWDNKEEVRSFTDLSRGDDRLRQTPSQERLIEVWEYWGKIPKSYITGKKSDAEEMVDGHMVCTNLSKGQGNLHLIEENKGGLKPYEEAWYARVRNRWYGRGPAERIMHLQVWMNTIVNIRINRSYVSQLGIFKVKQGSGITAQMVGRLAANGAIMVKNMDDIQQLPIDEASQASYNDEEVIKGWAERVNSTFDAASGENLPSSTSATASVIQARAAQSSFMLVKEGLGFFLQRWLKRHALPILQKRLNRMEVLRITGEVDQVREFDERIINEMLLQELEKMHKDGKFFTQQDVDIERERLREKLAAGGMDRYVEIKDKIKLDDYDVQVFITNEEVDKGVLVTNLNQTLQMVGSIPGIDIDPADIVRQIYDVLGLEAPKKQAPRPVEGRVPEIVPVESEEGLVAPENAAVVPNEQSVVTNANTLAG